MDAITCSKLNRLREVLVAARRVAVAFSGGVDSSFVLRAAADAVGCENVLAITGVSRSVAGCELQDAKQVAGQVGVEHILIDSREFDDPNYLANPTNRCFFCKSSLYQVIEGYIASRFADRAGEWRIANGTNLDDLGDFRPGLQAAKNHEILSPCVEAGLTKAEIRLISAAWGLHTADKPASPCLSSRVPYGESITPEKLHMIERAEELLRRLGFRESRVRHHDKLARIEVPAAQLAALVDPAIRHEIDAGLRALGYQFVTLDIRGFRSGSLNEVIAFGRSQGI